ncbi:MAG TPA: glycosyltransferase family 4 protein [Mycobacteriales bacterium]|nr:glycosyltransferase family 4 protein [Mycobacteriales bacterium]
MTGHRIALVLATSTGGTGRHVRALAADLVVAGDRVVVLGPAETEETFDFTGTGARFVPLAIAHAPRPGDVRTIARLRRYLHGAGLVHAHGLRAAAIAALANAGSRRPLVVTWHNLPMPGTGGGRLAPALESLVARSADLTLTVSPDLAERVRERGGRDVRVAPVAAAPLPEPARTVAQVRAELGATDRPLIVSVGRLHQQKGHATLIAAAQLLADRRSVPLVAIAGSGPLWSQLQAQIGSAPVQLLGFRRDVSALLAAADAIVLPSIWEGSPLAAQEAVRAGTPLIATAVGGVPTLIGDGADLIEPGDEKALAAAIGRVLDDPDYAAQLADRARAAAGRLPTEAAVSESVARCYDELLGRVG